MTKLPARDRARLVVLAYESGLVTPHNSRSPRSGCRPWWHRCPHCDRKLSLQRVSRFSDTGLDEATHSGAPTILLDLREQVGDASPDGMRHLLSRAV